MNDHSMFRVGWYGRSHSAGQARFSMPAFARAALARTARSNRAANLAPPARQQSAAALIFGAYFGN